MPSSWSPTSTHPSGWAPDRRSRRWGVAERTLQAVEDQLEPGQLHSMALSPFVSQRLGTPWVAKLRRADLETWCGLIESGTVTPAVDRVLPLDGVPDAMRALEAGQVRGKIVIAVNEG